MTRENAHTSARLGESQHAKLYPTKTSALQDSVCGKRRTPLFRVNATALTFIAKCLLLVHTLPYLPIFIINMKTESENVNVSVTHSCPTLCNAMDCSPPGSCPGDSPGKDTRVGSRFLPQEIFQPRDQTWVS